MISVVDQVEELLTRGVVNTIPSKEELGRVLRSGKRLNVYLGIDTTSPHIHLGHAVNLRKLKALIDLGHRVTFLIGDFTTRVGDNSDKESERPLLAAAEIEANWQTYKAQASRILDFSQVRLRHNSEWLAKLDFGEVLKLCQQFSLNDYISREIMKAKLNKGVSIRLDEVLYPIMQGYDSYFMDTDLQVGGADQTFNMQAGRTLQKKLRGKDSFVLVNQYLTGTDGRKMSKSWGNAIWLDDAPNDIYGKAMAIRDGLIEEYFVLATSLSESQISQLKAQISHPMELKKKLAWQIVAELHSPPAAEAAQKHFESTFQEGQAPADVPQVEVKSTNIVDVLVESGLAASRSAARRLIAQGGVQAGKQKVVSEDFSLRTFPCTLKVGPRKFVKITAPPAR